MCNGFICYLSYCSNFGGVSLNSNKYNDVLTLTVSSVMALYVVCYFSKKIENSHIGHLLSKCGKDSFYIMGHYCPVKVDK